MENSGIAVSLIVPVYNVSQYLRRCVDTLTHQTLENIQIILVNDGSTDDSGQICDELVKSDSRIQVIHKKNGGLSSARNCGFEIAKGEYIGFVDSDDYVNTEMFATMYSYAKKYNADYVRCNHLEVDEDGNDSGTTPDYCLQEGLYEDDSLREKLLFPMLGKKAEEGKEGHIGISVWRAIYRKSIIDANQLYFASEREVISEDIPFNMDFLCRSKRAYVLTQRFYYYVLRNGSLTKTFREDRLEKELKLNSFLAEKAKKLGIYEECKIRLDRLLIDRERSCIGKLSRNSNYSMYKKHHIIRELLRNDDMQRALHEIPIRKLPLKYRIVAYMMKYRCATLILCISNKL